MIILLGEDTTRVIANLHKLVICPDIVRTAFTPIGFILSGHCTYNYKYFQRSLISSQDFANSSTGASSLLSFFIFASQSLNLNNLLIISSTVSLGWTLIDSSLFLVDSLTFILIIAQFLSLVIVSASPHLNY